MAQEEDPNIFFRELMKSKPTPENRAACLANHKKLIELAEKEEKKPSDSIGDWLVKNCKVTQASESELEDIRKRLKIESVPPNTVVKRARFKLNAVTECPVCGTILKWTHMMKRHQQTKKCRQTRS
jgi:hypothetical protein